MREPTSVEVGGHMVAKHNCTWNNHHPKSYPVLEGGGGINILYMLKIRTVSDKCDMSSPSFVLLY